MFIELLDAQVRHEDELHLYGDVTVLVEYGNRTLKAAADIKFRKEPDGGYRLINDTDWLNRYQINPQMLSNQVLEYLKIK